MADRRFKNISYLLETEGYHLIRPPSFTADKASSKLEIIETKRMATVRYDYMRYG